VFGCYCWCIDAQRGVLKTTQELVKSNDRHYQKNQELIDEYTEADMEGSVG
jgi:hypothetical protein